MGQTPVFYLGVSVALQSKEGRPGRLRGIWPESTGWLKILLLCRVASTGLCVGLVTLRSLRAQSFADAHQEELCPLPIRRLSDPRSLFHNCLRLPPPAGAFTGGPWPVDPNAPWGSGAAGMERSTASLGLVGHRCFCCDAGSSARDHLDHGFPGPTSTQTSRGATGKEPRSRYRSTQVTSHKSRGLLGPLARGRAALAAWLSRSNREI